MQSAAVELRKPMESAAVELQNPTESAAVKLQNPTESVADELQNPMVSSVQKPIEFSTVEFLKSMDSAAAVSDATSPAAMAVLADEFRHILLSHTIPVETGLTSVADRFSSSSSYTDSEESWYSQDSWTNSKFQVNSIPIEAIDYLRCIAGRMTAAGYSRECVEAYTTARKTVLNEIFNKLGIEELSSKTILTLQREKWSAVALKIRPWIHAAKFSFRVLFLEERGLSEQIFGNLETDIVDACFVEAIKDFATNLFNFVQAISSSRISLEKLFKFLDLHQVLSDLLPDIRAIFTSKSGKFLREQAAELCSSLAEAVRETLSEFENAVLREPSKPPLPGGGIHPLTRYVMNYIRMISDYKQTLIELIVSKPSTGPRYSSDPNVPDMDFSEYEDQASTLELHLIWIIVILQFNLDGKSEQYKDISLAHLFMMNNVHYIVHKIEGSPELREMIGDNYVRKLTGKFRLAATSYQRATWVRVLYCLRDEGLHVSGSFSSGVSKSALRERFKSFNAMFEKVHRTQATWLVPHAQLREELRISMLEKLIPAYRSFLGRFRSHIESGRHPENYIKYSGEDLENAVLDFFEG